MNRNEIEDIRAFCKEFKNLEKTHAVLYQMIDKQNKIAELFEKDDITEEEFLTLLRELRF